MLLAAPMVAVLGRYAARFSVRADDLTLDFSLVWFGIALALVAAVFLAFVPRLPSADASRGLGLTSSERASPAAAAAAFASSPSRRSPRRSCCSPAPACSCGLSSCSSRPSPPFDTAHVLAVNLPVMSYGRTPEQVRDFYRDVQRRIATLPGVEHVSTGFSVPWRDDQGLRHQLRLRRRGRHARERPGRSRAPSSAPYRLDFFATLGVPILEGRDFRDTDKDGSERVVIISQSVAK